MPLPRLLIHITLLLAATCYCKYTVALTAQAAATDKQKNLLVQRFTQSQDGQDKLNAMHDAVFDPKGFLWLATEAGLKRFDGTHILSFSTEDGLSGQWVLSLTFDHRGELWAGTNNGLSQFSVREHTFTQYLTGEYISDVIESRNRILYAATPNGIMRFNADRHPLPTWVAGPQGLSHNFAQALFEDSHGNIWIGYHNAGLSRWSPFDNSFNHFSHIPGDSNSLCHSDVRAINEDQHGHIWVGTLGGGLCRLNSDGRTFTPYPLTDAKGAVTSNIVTSILVDSHKSLWVSTDKGGVYHYSAKQDTFSHYQHDPLDPRSLMSNTVRRITEDAYNNLWFTTFPAGLSRHNPSTTQFQSWQQHPLDNNSLSNSSILALHQDAHGDIWVGTENGLNHIKRSSGLIVRYPHIQDQKNSVPAPAITALADGPQGHLWIGTWSGGLARLNKHSGQIKIYNTEHNFKGKNIWAIYLDQRNTLWIGTEQEGLYRFNEKEDSFEQYRHDISNPHSINSNYVLSIEENHQGELWIGTQNGISQFIPSSNSFKHESPLKNSQNFSQRIKLIFIDNQKNVWLATQGNGLIKWTHGSNQLIYIDKSRGLPNNTVSAIQQDQQGFIWVSTLAGIAKISPSNHTVETVLILRDGLPGDVSNRNASLALSDGTLYFGTTQGLVSFNPGSLKLPAGEPNIELTHLAILGKKAGISPNDSQSPLTEGLPYTHTITLKQSDNFFEIGFANLNMSFGGHTEFSYKLENHDKNWTHRIGNSSASYANVPAGKYRLIIRAKNRKGEWSPDERTLNIHITPPITRSTLAHIIYSLIALMVSYVIVRLIFLRTLNNKLHLEVNAKTEALQEANAAKTLFLANVSHELRTPLNAINGYSSRLLKRYSSILDKRAIESLKSINRNGVHLNNLINDILDLSKIESGKMAIEIADCNIDNLLKHCIADIQESAAAKGLVLQPPSTDIYGTIQADEQRVTQIVHNLLSNAVKYSDKGKIELRVETVAVEDQKYCAISVKDTGKGIREEDLKKLFTRFEQVDQDTKYIHGYGTGLGLALVDEFTSLHGGFVRCESKLGEGSTFTVYLPIVTPILSE